MSVCEDRVIGNTLQSDDTRILECPNIISFSSECCEFRQVYSSAHFITATSHDQFSWIIILEFKCTITKSNGSQFRQIYSSFSFCWIHSQTLHENNHGMYGHQTICIMSWRAKTEFLPRGGYMWPKGPIPKVLARGPHISPEIPDIMTFIPLWTKKTNRTDSAKGIMLISFETIAILASSEVFWFAFSEGASQSAYNTLYVEICFWRENRPVVCD